MLVADDLLEMVLAVLVSLCYMARQMPIPYASCGTQCANLGQPSTRCDKSAVWKCVAYWHEMFGPDLFGIQDVD
jgi:hypothetical protein